jgi:hypothetical protein
MDLSDATGISESDDTFSSFTNLAYQSSEQVPIPASVQSRMQSEVQYLFESSFKAEKAHEAPATLEERLAPLTSYLDEHLQVTAREQSQVLVE